LVEITLSTCSWPFVYKYRNKDCSDGRSTYRRAGIAEAMWQCQKCIYDKRSERHQTIGPGLVGLHFRLLYTWHVIIYNVVQKKRLFPLNVSGSKLNYAYGNIFNISNNSGTKLVKKDNCIFTNIITTCILYSNCLFCMHTTK